MACSSHLVESITKKSNHAQEVINDLQNKLISKDNENNDYFDKLISKKLDNANIGDARVINTGKEMKTEYISEFSLDKITDFIIKALKIIESTVVSSKIPTGVLDAYLDLVNSVCEAAKSNSSVVKCNSFSMTRMSPGLFVFLYSVALNIKDSDLFGNESVCSTVVYYKIIESIDDIKNESQHELAAIDRESILKLKQLQAALLIDLKNGIIDTETWNKKDTEYSNFIKKTQERLNCYHFDNVDSIGNDNLIINNNIVKHVKNAIVKLDEINSNFNLAIIRSKERMKNSYYR